VQVQAEDPAIAVTSDPRIDESSGLVVAPGIDLVKRNCVVCHSARLVTQNRGDAESWLSMIRWMQKKQGLWPLGEDEAPIVAYLASNYGPLKVGRRGNLPAATWTFAQEQWIDLTHDLSEDAVFWPTAEPFKLTTDFAGVSEAGYYYSSYSFSGAEHGGTHIDAPVHFAEGKNHVDEIPLSQLIGDAVVIDVRPQAASNRDHRVSVADIKAWELKHGEIPKRSIVLIQTGFAEFWPDTARYLGTTLRGEAGVKELSFPGLGVEAARWLVAERMIKSVGIDTASIDHGKSTDFATHVELMTRNVPAFENVASLDALPATGVYVVALPVKIRGGSGGPLRIIARRTSPGQIGKQP
jgi:kynurenine formamidase